MTDSVNVYLPAIVGKGYAEFWKFKGRYRAVTLLCLMCAAYCDASFNDISTE